MPSSRRCSRIDQHFITDFLASDPDHLIAGVNQRLTVPVPGLDSQFNPGLGFPTDKWLLSSAVQKLIRRGRAEQAVKTALALHALDPAYLPRRLPIVAFEDISIGDLGVCFDILHVFGRQRFAANTSEIEQRQILANLVHRLARSVKSRSACDILCLAYADPGLPDARLAKASEKCLIKVAADRNAADTRRALALHLLSGLSIQERGQYRTVSRFSADGLSAVAEKLGLVSRECMLLECKYAKPKQ